MKKLREYLESADQALELPKGCLLSKLMLWYQVDFDQEFVLTAANYLIKHGDVHNLVSQAAVIVRAGKDGWGRGDVYKVMPSFSAQLFDPKNALLLPIRIIKTLVRRKNCGKLLISHYLLPYSPYKILSVAMIRLRFDMTRASKLVQNQQLTLLFTNKLRSSQLPLAP